jgi:hypothetical protein
LLDADHCDDAGIEELSDDVRPGTHGDGVGQRWESHKMKSGKIELSRCH